MTVGSREFEELIKGFEMNAKKSPIRTIFNKETKEMWVRGHIYQDGHTNDLFLLYRAGYSHARCVYQQ